MKKNDIYKTCDKIENFSDFIAFLSLLNENISNKPDEWENTTVKSYLNGAYGFCTDSKFEENSWKVFAEILLAARVYE